MKKISKRIVNFPVSNFFVVLFVINIIFIYLGIYFYKGTFLFWQYPFSDIGATKAIGGIENYKASLIYTIDMILSGLIMLGLTYHYYKKIHKRNLLITVLCFLCGGGFIIAGLSPDDIRPNIHVLGSALAITALWILATNYLFEIKKQLKPKVYYLLQSVLQIPIFAYAFAYFSGTKPADGILQKFTLAGMSFVLIYATSYYQKFNDKVKEKIDDL